jgi:hypothetical protein
MTTYVTSIADWRAQINEQEGLFTEYFKGEFPTNTLVEIRALAEPVDAHLQRMRLDLARPGESCRLGRRSE